MAVGDNIRKNIQDQKEFNKAIDEGLLAYREYEDLFKSIQSELGKKVSQVRDATKSYDQLVSATSQLKLNEEEITRLTDRQLEAQENKARAALADLKYAAESLSFQKQKLIEDKNGNLLQGAALEAKIKSKLLSGEISKEEAALLRAKATNFKFEEEMVAKAGEDVEKRKELNKALGVSGGILKGINELAGGFAGAFGLDQVQKDMEKFAEKSIKAGKSVSRLQTLGVGIKSAFGQLATTLTDPAVIIGALVKGFKEVDKANVDFMRQTGQDLNTLSTSVDSANMHYVNMADYIKTASELTKELGQNAAAIFSPEDIIEAAEMTEAMGMAGKEAANLARLSKINGGNIKAQNESIVAGVNASNKQNKTAVAAGDILKEVANVSEGIAISYAGYPEELGKAAAAARGLGMSLEDVDKISESLLNFQQSIEDEMAAELLTGKQLNLETARQLALNNDLAGVAEELSKQGLNSTEFSKMNRIQQEAQAKALGMSRDQMAKMLLSQEMSKGLSEDALSAAQKQTLEQLKQEEASEKMKKAMEKLAQAFAPIVGFFADIVSNTYVLYSVIGVALLAKMGPLVKAAQDLGGGFKDALTNAQELGKGLMDLAKGQGGGKLKEALGLGEMDKPAAAASKAADSTKEAAAGGAKQGKEVKGFLKGLGDGLASIGKQAGDVIKGGLALGVVGVILGGSFALAMMMVKDVDPVQMIAFAGALAIFGATAALIGKLGGQVMQGAAALLVMGLALVPAAFAFSLLEGLDTDALIAFSIALPLLSLAAAGLGFIAPFIIAGSVALGALGLALIPLAYGFSQIEGTDSTGIVTSLATFAGLAPGLAAVAVSLFAVAGGLGAMAVAGLAALPVMAGLAGLGTVATGIAGVLGLGGEGGEGEAAPANNDTAILAQKLDQMNATLSAILAKEGTITLDGTKVGTALTVGSSKLQ